MEKRGEEREGGKVKKRCWRKFRDRRKEGMLDNNGERRQEGRQKTGGAGSK
jgi:hypothetical protein